MEKYTQYIKEHQGFVKDAWMDLQKYCSDMPYVMDDYLRYFITDLISKHDESKLSLEEYEGYRKYFHPTETDDLTNKDAEYQVAWEHHYSNNPHHWEYWTIYDAEKERDGVRFIRECYMVEMVCDWMAMSKKFNNSVHEWYDENKDEIILIPEDRILVENILEKIPQNS